VKNLLEQELPDKKEEHTKWIKLLKTECIESTYDVSRLHSADLDNLSLPGLVKSVLRKVVQRYAKAQEQGDGNGASISANPSRGNIATPDASVEARLIEKQSHEKQARSLQFTSGDHARAKRAAGEWAPSVASVLDLYNV
jgi:hypothetical protein